VSEHDGHDDHHGHHHPRPRTPVEARVDAFEALLVERGLLDASEVDAVVAYYEHDVGPMNGARVVARAWIDPDYKRRMLADGSKAAEEIGLDIGPLRLVVVENTPSVHNVIVCTLCSCYPRMLLGLPPDWYKSRNYRSRVVRDPRAVLAEFGTTIPDDTRIRVHDSTADMRYLVMPMRPEGTENLSEADLARLVTRDSMIGVALADPPSEK